MALHVRNRLYLVAPLFLGDAFVINALVRRWCTESDQVCLPVQPHNWDTVQALYSDVPNLKLVPFVGDQEEQDFIQTHKMDVINFRTIYEVSRINWKGVADEANVPVNWDRQIYEYFDVPYSRRYQEFRVPLTGYSNVIWDALKPPGDFVLFHRYCSNHVGPIGIDLPAWRNSVGAPDLPIIEITTGHSSNLLDWIPLIHKAQEIHCVGSSVHCLVDGVDTPARLFYHGIRQNTLVQVNSRWNNWKWHTVHYDYKI